MTEEQHIKEPQDEEHSSDSSESGEDQPGTFSMGTEKLAKLILEIAEKCNVQNLELVQNVACQLKCNIDAVKQELWSNMEYRKDLYRPTESWVVQQWKNTDSVVAEQFAKGNAQNIKKT